MNRVNPKKLHNSKWTAAESRDKEKHFLVTDVILDADGHPQACILEAVISRREIRLDWRDLRDARRWRMGWL
ncbi:MAG: TIGR02450 family Trp-rich protein [Gammaproteobacteria bacterium]|nr:TIGR02450 family Trp-rich protein [Gammaproteobacteria bacterium]NND35772.1 TIGR02450 family Trp-rich protein [Gammaproteobacteria bacterium]